MTSTCIQWTMKLSDAALINDTLREAAEDAERQADYLSSDAYADQQREAFAHREDKPKRKDWPGLSDHDLKRIDENRRRAARLRELIES